MDLIGYFRVLRRRWVYWTVPAVGALLVAWVTLPEQAEVGPAVQSYTASATLIATPTSTTASPISLSTVSLFTTLGDVPERAARKLGYRDEPQILASLVTVTPQGDTNTLTISSTDSDDKLVAERVNAFAQAAVAYFRERQREEALSRVDGVNAQIRSVTRELRKLQRSIGRSEGDPVLDARQTSLKAQYSTLYSQLGDLNQLLGSPGPLDVLQPGVAIPVASTGFTAPSSPLVRLGIGSLLGLLLGAAIALFIERIDSRLRSREEAEESFGLPVLAEIPSLPVAQRGHRSIVSAEMPASATAEAFRTLRSSVLLLGPDAGMSAQRTGEGRGLVVLVTSARPGEGKTTTVANLATVMAEAGRSVLVLDMDLRSPRMHELFGVENATGVSDLLGADRAAHLGDVARSTPFEGVRLATSGHRLDHPGALLASAGSLLERARSLADVVLVDSAPLLTVSDAIDLAQHIDLALVVTRLNKTTTTQAAAAQRLLSRLAVPALGTVLVGAASAGRSDGGYRFHSGPSRRAEDDDTSVLDNEMSQVRHHDQGEKQ